MINKIKELEKSALLLEPQASQRTELLSKIIKYSENFLENIYSLPSYNFTEGKGISLLDSPISDEPEDINKLLQLLKDNVDTPGLNPASRGHLGYIPGGGIYHSALADFLADVTNRYAGVFFASPGAVRMENMLTSWMTELIGYPATSAGNLTSGGSIANLSAIVSARDAFNLKAKDFERTVIYMTSQAHHSIDKAIRIAGLGECIHKFIPVDENYRMLPAQLQKTITEDRKAGLNPWLVIAAAGTTDVGAVDPLEEIGAISKANNLWFHIDGAYGAFFILTYLCKDILKGLSSSDSIIMDPHKSLFLPYGSGAVLVKDKLKLLESNHYQANYMQDAMNSKDELSPADLSPELSKHFRGLRLWLPLKLLGVKPFRDALEEKVLLTRYFYERMKEIDGFEVGPYPDLSVATYRYIPKQGDVNNFNAKLVQAVQQDGRLFISSTMLDGKFTLRLAVLSFRTHIDTIDQLIEILQEKIKILTNS
ncbi:MAG TPA: aminotransferase class V-fold PLP-dependent enzyme [Ignavibacteriaceae bacterium]|nr:aminotransferase class V-fold PLP-dependent enzyme [Ignavibacteriaceae bacterium]